MAHYSNVQHPEAVLKWAKYTAQSIIEAHMGKNTLPVLVYRGMSGVGAATVLMVELHRQEPELKFGMIYVRKEEEKSHGDPVEPMIPYSEGYKKVACFVDDFICSGTTARACWEATRLRCTWDRHTQAYYSGRDAGAHGLGSKVSDWETQL